LMTNARKISGRQAGDHGAMLLPKWIDHVHSQRVLPAGHTSTLYLHYLPENLYVEVIEVRSDSQHLLRSLRRAIRPLDECVNENGCDPFYLRLQPQGFGSLVPINQERGNLIAVEVLMLFGLLLHLSSNVAKVVTHALLKILKVFNSLIVQASKQL